MMFVSDIFNEAKKIFGHCLEPKLFEWISDGVELLANKGEIDPLVAFVDLCVHGQCITTPREVETILAVNICGHPALGHDVMFSFHLNGPGDHSRGCGLDWFDVGNFPTYRDISCPSKLIAFLDNPADAGKELRVFGFDDQNRPLRSQEGNIWRDGVLVPTIFGYALPDANAQVVSRITQIQKDRTVANIRLSSFDNSTQTGTLLGIFEPDEVTPLYRRFRISRGGSNHGCGSTWVRICFRKRTARVYSLNDRIYLHSRMALILALRALKSYDDIDIPNGNMFEANAVRLLTERESVLTGVGVMPMQVLDRNQISDKFDYVD